ncbi:hypothetical protein A176_005767 [Myxococcus hansupus]|uniref:DUF4390 domain-containing protein n=1 Tax=Pseudomyxococcus hansupus TaxID=1297742 RepID=A0A0H4X5H3_9BACT|nr:hypothetical protein [Myxococcus hansupus]AKQ68855.1 hypothetical protein A176_005767 [Myxococcus hansupus]
MDRALTHWGRRFGTALIAVSSLLAPTVHAMEPRTTCTASLSGRRVMVRPEAFDFVSLELDRLVRLGMAGKLEVELTLWRKNAIWFDARVDTTRLTQVLAFGGGLYLLDQRPLPDGASSMPLERVAWTLAERPTADARFEVRVSVRLQVVTAASLGRVAAWLTQGKPAPVEEGSTLTGTVLRSVAEDLSRSASGRCDVTRPP